MNKKEDHLAPDFENSTASDTLSSTEVEVKISGSPHEEMIQEYVSCILCGGEKLFTHITDFCEEVVYEESFCPNCNIKNKKVAHKLQ